MTPNSVPNVRYVGNHAEAEKSLRKKLRLLLSNLRLSSDEINWSDNFNYLKDILDDVQRYYSRELKWVDFYGPMLDETSKLLNIKKVEAAKAEQKLSPAELEILETKLLDFLRALPKQYIFFVRLSSPDSVSIQWLKEIGDEYGLELISFADVLKLGFSLEQDSSFANFLFERNRSINFFLENLQPLRLQPEEKLFTLFSTGFCNGKFDDSAAETATNTVRVLFYLFSLLGICQRENVQGEHPYGHIYFAENSDTDRVLKRIRLPSSLATELANYKLVSPQTSLLANDKMFAGLFKKILSKESEESEPIRTASYWASLSYAQYNHTTSFIFCCLALESILGDGNPENVTATLANRCGYLLGRDRATRTKYIEEFKEIYKVRSKIVHGRRARLERDEERLLKKAKEMMDDVIKRELLNLEASELNVILGSLKKR